MWLEPDYFDQLTSEERIVEKRNGRARSFWKRIKGKKAEVLDTFVYAIASRLSLPSNIEQSYLKKQANLMPSATDAKPSSPEKPDYILNLKGIQPETKQEQLPPPVAQPKTNRYARLFQRH
jgi:phage terminase large subunit GpA-like protein